MIGVSRKFNPVDLNPEYYVDFGVSQTYRISDWSSSINKGSNNTFNTSDWSSSINKGSNNTFNTSDYKYYLDFPSITTQNFLAGGSVDIINGWCDGTNVYLSIKNDWS